MELASQSPPSRAKFLVLFSALCLFFSASGALQAKDLTGRLGAGLTNLGSKGNKAISVDWQATTATAFEVNFGLDTYSSEGGWDLGFRASRNIFIEDNMFFSLFVGAGLVQQKSAQTSITGYLLETGIGSKFFFEGLPNLGFSFLGALQVIDVGSFGLRVTPLLGVHYYF